MKIAGKTLGYSGKILEVFECEHCKKRSVFPAVIIKCEDQHKKDFHEEEFKVGIL